MCEGVSDWKIAKRMRVPPSMLTCTSFEVDGDGSIQVSFADGGKPLVSDIASIRDIQRLTSILRARSSCPPRTLLLVVSVRTFPELLPLLW